MDIAQLENRLVKELEGVDWSSNPGRGSKLADLMRRLVTTKQVFAEIVVDFERLGDNDGGASVTPSSPTAPPGRGPRKTMVRCAVEELEKENDLHYEEITRRMLAGGYVTRGSTPERSVNAELTRHPELFEPLGHGYYRLRR
jgi:hypothetical protein